MSAGPDRRIWRNVVFTDAMTGYVFYPNSTADLVYEKTSDGGQTWGAPVTVFTGGVICFDVWFDQWTPGDAGTIIHCWFQDSGTDDVLYKNLDTSGDTLGSLITVFAGAGAGASVTSYVSGTKTRGGNLLVSYFVTTSGNSGTYRSTDGGATFGSVTNLVEAAGDWALAFPGNEADDQDAWFLYMDVSADELTLKTYDDSGNSFSESSVIATLIDSTNDGNGQYPFSGAIRHSDGHLIVALCTDLDSATGDFRVFDIDGAGSITELTAIATNIDDLYYPSVFVADNDQIYIAYTGKRDGSQTLGTTASVFYALSSDGGSTWSAGDTAYSVGSATYRQTHAPLNGERFIVMWREATGTNLLTNYDNSVEIGDALVVGGALTLGGGLVLSVGKPLGGTLATAGGALRSDVTKAIAGSMATAGAGSYIAVTLLALTATLTSSGDPTHKRCYAEDFSGSLAPTGDPALAISKSPAGTMATAGALTKSQALVLDGELIPTGDTTIFPFRNLAAGGTLTTAGAAGNAFSRAMTATLGLAAAIVRTVSKALSGTLTTASAVAVGRQEAPCNVTLGEMVTELWRMLDDDGTYYTRLEVWHAVNAAQRLFCFLTLCLERTVTFTLTNGQTFYEIDEQVADFYAPLRVTYGGVRLTPDTIHNLDLRNRRWRNQVGDPVRYAQEGVNLLAITPQPATGSNSLQLTYAAEPAELISDMDAPEIPPDQQLHLLDFAYYWLRLKEGGEELQTAVPYLQRFLDAAQKYQSFARAKARGQNYDRRPIQLSTVDRSRFEVKFRRNWPREDRKDEK